MAVDNNRILTKLIQEAHMAKENQQNEVKMLKHIEKIKLLCELFLDEETEHREITEEERRMMFGEGQRKIEEAHLSTEKPADDEDANGFSIFDF